MTTKILGFAAGIAILATIWLPVFEACAQNTFSSAPTPIEMVAVVGNGAERRLRSLDGVMEPVGLPAGGQITLTLEAPTGKAGQRVSLRLLDGGEIVAAPPLSMASDGTASFTFKAGDTRGLYRVEVTIGVEQYELQLYAVKLPGEGTVVVP
jgi:hypothetical protein